MSRKALLVGINEFANPSWRLHGCANDTLAMRALLTTYFGFEDSDIHVLRDQHADSRGIRHGLGWLLSDYGGQDVRVFHFSSHGTRVPDWEGDEPDGADEVIVPYDHDWDKPFRDDDLKVIFDAIPPGVNFSFIADCCHSGSMQKGLLDLQIEFTPRYLSPPQRILDGIAQLRGAREETALQSEAEQVLAGMAQVQDAPRAERMQKARELLSAQQLKRKQNKFGITPDQAHFTLAACEDRQTAADARIEGAYRGAFTWALAKAVNETQGNVTYRDLIVRAGEALKPFEQIPQLACPVRLRNSRLFAPLV